VLLKEPVEGTGTTSGGTMSQGQAVGLDQVGGVTLGVNRNADAQDARVQHARRFQEMANTIQGANRGPEMRTQVSGKLNQAGAQGASANHSNDYNVKKHQAEKTAVQGANEATQTQATSASLAETTFGSLNRSL
jgi:hypothetical protein